MDGKFETIGGYVFGTIIHELGHALGLGHAGPYNGDVDPATQQFSIYDNLAWSIMSYIEPGDDTAKFFNSYLFSTDWGMSADGYTNTPTTMMSLDILAIQRLYGAPTESVLSGNQTFGFNTDIPDPVRQFFDFTINTVPIVTIYSTGTGNTLDLSGYSTAATVDLNPGTFSSCDGMTNNLCIAYNTSVDSYVGSTGIDTVTANSDVDSLLTGTGNDSFFFGASLTAADHVNGGGGADTLNLDGTYANLVFGASTVVNVETIDLAAGHSYKLTTNDATVASGKTLTVDGTALASGQVLTFSGAAETNGKLVVKGGAGNDGITGGAGDDTITGGAGNDTLNGGAGANKITGGSGADTIAVTSGTDTLLYTSATQSSHATFDTISHFDFAANDHFDLNVAVSGIGTRVTSGTLDTASFDIDMAAAIDPAHLAAHNAVLFTATTGTAAGTYLIVDANGMAGYQGGADYVFLLTSALHTGSLDTTDFV